MRATATPVRRLNINLPENVADELQDIANKSHRTMTDVVRTALALVKIASDASEKNQKLVVADESGKPIKEVVLPR
jgi:predicted transcriptional regulator